MSFENVIEEVVDIKAEEETSVKVINPTKIEDAIKGKIATKAYNCLIHYKWGEARESAISKAVRASWTAKTSLRKIFRNHPMWDEEQQAIVFAANFSASQDLESIKKFVRWIRDNYESVRKKDADFFIPNYYSISSYECLLREHENIKRLTAEGKRAEEEYNHWLDGYFYGKKKYDVWSYLYDFTTVENLSNAIIDEEFVTATEKFGEKLKAVVGQKKSRYIAKLYKHFGFTDIVDIHEIHRNGELVKKDYGWNYYFAMYGDAVNPINITKYTVLSINFLDYLTMSFGKGWASCQCIDRYNVDGRHHTYDGCASSGTLSYAGDEVTAIFYTVDENYNGEMWKAPKDRRMNFHIANDGRSFCYGRMYPDGRDGGETGLAAQFRKTVQKILAECLDENNLWQAPQKGTDACENWVEEAYGATNYTDFFCYGDCGISAMKGTELETIYVGSSPICICCGDEHDRKESLVCDDCDDSYDNATCDHCGCGINTNNGRDGDDYYYCEENEVYFCCRSCYENAGYVMCDDGHIHCEDDCNRDDYDGEWYYCDYYDGIIPADDYWYVDEDNANADGWIELEDPNGNYKWYRVEDLKTDELTGEYISEDWDGVFSPNGTDWYLNATNAAKNGWHPTFDDIVRLAENGDIEEWEKN